MRALSFTDSLCNKTRFVVEALARFSPEVGEFSATTNLNLTYRLLPQFFPKKPPPPLGGKKRKIEKSKKG